MQINYLHLFNRLASDVGLDPLTVRYCSQRVKSEGLPFLTVTLPNLVKAILRSLELGYFDRPTSFAWKGRSLRYFQSLLIGIFGPDGRVLSEPDSGAIYRIRQLGEYLYKLAVPYSDEKLSEFEQNFLSTECEVRSELGQTPFVDQLRRDFETHFAELSRKLPEQLLSEARPRYGPGTFAGTREQKMPFYLYKQVKAVTRGYLASCRAISGFLKPYPSAPVKMHVTADTSETSEVLFVPKDSRGPRVICREPLHALKLQMAFFDSVTPYLERISRGRINFRDQQVNRELARTSSISRDYATIDLKDASDRVPFSVINTIFRNSPGCRYFLRFRTQKFRTPSGVVGSFKKLAGMGSGLTFASLALVIYLAVVRGLSDVHRLPYGEAMKMVYVYGDDIIVPRRYLDTAVQSLTRVGLLVNAGKTFSQGHFRESCGADYFMGDNVAPVRLRLSNAKLQSVGLTLLVSGPGGLLQLERHCRELVKYGLDATADYLYSVIERDYGSLPYVAGETPVLGRYSAFDSVEYPTDEHGNYQQIRVLYPVPEVRKASYLDEYYHLASKVRPGEYSPLGFLSSVEGSTFGEVSVPRQVRIVRRKISAFRAMG